MSVLTTAAVALLYDALFLNGGFTVMTRPDGSTYTPTGGYAVSTTPAPYMIPTNANGLGAGWTIE
ncbi:hypothetical protein IAG44_04680 [Streptomyces roseirectus]|uniref:Uncharacterized protein n=1 Tax=Streptomyces roseirectus TaxID=2768066 RepID=A0A7H0I7Q7_9ACTN|nr:hypothetical protein [Streptomyces roseirectus]QNP68823.1 hypothetical protein IAG44_04680 [Streptomyces roseirectus]